MERRSEQIVGDHGPRPETSGLSVLGWLLVCFAVPPLAMGAAAYGTSYLWVGGGMMLGGIALVVLGRHRRPPADTSRG